jgi:hypothetical protein
VGVRKEIAVQQSDSPVQTWQEQDGENPFGIPRPDPWGPVAPQNASGNPLALNADILADRQSTLHNVHSLICVANGLLYQQRNRERHSDESEILSDWASRLGAIMREIYKALDPEGRG